VLSEASYQTALFRKRRLEDSLGAETGTLPTDQGFDHLSGHVNGNIVTYFGWPKAILTTPSEAVADNEILVLEWLKDF